VPEVERIRSPGLDWLLKGGGRRCLLSTGIKYRKSGDNEEDKQGISPFIAGSAKKRKGKKA